MKNLTLAISLSLFALAAHSTEKAPLFTIASDVASLQDSDIGNAKKTGATTAVKLKSKAGKTNGKALFQISHEPKAQEAAAKVATSNSNPQSAPETAPANPLQTLAASGKDAAEKKDAEAEKAGKTRADVAPKQNAAKPAQTLAQTGKSESGHNAAQDAAVQTPAAAPDSKEAAPMQATAAKAEKPSDERSESALFKIASYYEADEMGGSDDAVRKINFSKPQGQQLPSELSAISNSKAIQRAAPLSSANTAAKAKSSGKTRKGSYSYVVRGKRYQTLASSDDFVQEGPASWYGPGFHGKKTASGEIYDMHKMTAAHKRLPLGTKLEVTNKRTGKTVVVTVNDRGPFHGNRILDLSHAAASQLGVLKSGVADVSIRAIK